MTSGSQSQFQGERNVCLGFRSLDIGFFLDEISGDSSIGGNNISLSALEVENLTGFFPILGNNLREPSCKHFEMKLCTTLEKESRLLRAKLSTDLHSSGSLEWFFSRILRWSKISKMMNWFLIFVLAPVLGMRAASWCKTDSEVDSISISNVCVIVIENFVPKTLSGLKSRKIPNHRTCKRTLNLMKGT